MNPIAFKIFNFEIRYYSLFILVGVTIAYFMIMRESKKFKMSEDSMFNMIKNQEKGISTADFLSGLDD